MERKDFLKWASTGLFPIVMGTPFGLESKANVLKVQGQEIDPINMGYDAQGVWKSKEIIFCCCSLVIMSP